MSTISEALRYIQDRRYDAALEILDMNPEHTTEWYAARRRCLALMQRFAEAAQEGAEAIALGAKDGDDYFHQARILVEAGEIKEAIEHAFQALARNLVPHYFAPLIQAVLLAPEWDDAVTERLHSLIIPAPESPNVAGLAVNLPQGLPYYRSFCGDHPFVMGMVQACSSIEFRRSEYDTFVPGRVFAALAFTRKCYERLRTLHPAVTDIAAAKYAASRFESLLYEARGCAIDLLSMAVLSLGQRPYVLVFDYLPVLFQPFFPYENTVVGVDSPYYWLVRDSLEADECLAIITTYESSASQLAGFFGSDAIREKCIFINPCFSADEAIGLPPIIKPAPVKRDEAAKTLLFSSSFYHNNENVFLRGLVDVLWAFLSLDDSVPNLRLLLRTPLPSNLGDRLRSLIENHPGIEWYPEKLPWSEYKTLLERADLFLLPAVTAYRNGLVQAMRHGIVPVVSDGAHLPELVEHGINGIVVPGRGNTSCIDIAGRRINQNWVNILSATDTPVNQDFQNRYVDALKEVLTNPKLLDRLRSNLHEVSSRYIPGISDEEAFVQTLALATKRAERLRLLAANPFGKLSADQRIVLAREGFDELIIANQYLDAPTLAAQISFAGNRKILIATTHQYFAEEQKVILAAAPNIVITPLADWYDDDILAQFDNEASASVLDGTSPYAREEHAVAINKENLRRRTLWFVERVRPLLTKGASIHFVPGLGNPSDVWEEVGAVAIARPLPTDEATPPEALKLTAVSKAGVCYLFVTPFRRVTLADGASVREAPLPADFPWQCIRNPLQAKATLDAIAETLLPVGAVAKLASTVHGFRSWAANLGQPINIIVDGFHPPNYSRSYIDYYPANAIFLAREPISAAWFSKFGWRTIIEPDILKPLRFQPPQLFAGHPLRILVALNHAGDWSALIHRSDTDRLVEAAGGLAAAYPNVKVRVRPHPSMTHTEHEGPQARTRIVNHLASRDLPTLTVSASSLDDDLDWADLVISEYSQVLIDAWSLGKLGIAVNLSGRRSYMEVYEALGFPAVTTEKALHEMIQGLMQDPDHFKTVQAAAAQEANATFEAAAGHTVSCPACRSITVTDSISHLDFPPTRLKACSICGHVFSAPSPNDEQLSSYYKSRLDAAWSALLGGAILDYMQERAEAQIDFIESAWNRGRRPDTQQPALLDLGCGIGALCNAWSKHGRPALGLDTNPAVVLAGRRCFNVDLRVQDIENALLESQQWDIIAMSHVLEHLPSPALHLEKLHHILKPEGWLFIEVPSTWPGYFENREDMEGHLHFFNPDSVRRMLERSGFHVQSIATFGPSVVEYAATPQNERDWNFHTRRHGERREEAHDGLWIRCLAYSASSVPACPKGETCPPGAAVKRAGLDA